jgi:cell shape-determining protein MreC
MLFTWFMLAGFIFLFSPKNLTNKFQLAFHRIFSWPLSIGRNISLSAGTRQPLGDVVSRDEYKRLLNHLANVTQQRDAEHQNVEKLAKMRIIPGWERMGFVPADVITVSINELRSELFLNRGEDDGLAKGQFVLADNSIIGNISDVDARTAKVRLFTDPKSSTFVMADNSIIGNISDVDARTAKVRLFTDPKSSTVVRIGSSDWLMQGNGGNLAKVKMIKSKVKIGTEVMASKRPGFLDTPVIIGRVARCERNAEPLLWDLIVEPVCNIQKVENVHVIVMNPPEVR